MAEGNHQAQRETWQRKPVLQAIYNDYYHRISGFCLPGRTLEVGGGSGNLKETIADVVSLDIALLDWLDLVADAQALPFADSSFANIVGVDILHHIQWPLRFFSEAERVLKKGGRLILLEPAITPVSWIFYSLFHPEPIIWDQDFLQDGQIDPDRDPFEANQAIPTLLVGKYRRQFGKLCPKLQLICQARFSFVAYPLSGGFRPWSLIPYSAVGPLLKIEDILAPLLGRLCAFRLLIVFEKI